MSLQFHGTGDFDACEMKALLEDKFAAWRPAASEPDQVPAVPNTPIPRFSPGADTVYLVDRPGLTQVSRFQALSAPKEKCHTPC